MRHGMMRRSLAAASAAAMAGAALVAGGGLASAAPISATAQVAGNLFESGFTITRTVSESAPTYGDVVTVTTNITRDNGGYLLYEVRDFTPACMEYQNGTAQANKGGDIEANTERVRWSYGIGRQANPFTMTAQYKITCNAGPVATGGTWMKRALAGNSELGNRNMGPTINVQRKGTSVFLHGIANPQVGQTVTLSADTTNIPDGSQVDFLVDGVSVGSGTVSGGTATHPWTPTTAGTKTVRAVFAQTATHGGSQSGERIVTVSPTNVNSNVTVDVAGTPKVGQSSQVTATVTPEGAGGTVFFKENGTVIGESTVDASGNASIGWIPTVAGQRTIDAEFSGRPGVNPSSNGVPVTVAEADPNQVATTTVLDPIATSPAGEEITLTARVSTDAPGGTVTFYDGSTIIGTAPVGAGGVATFEWTPTTDGVRTVRAEFSGEGVNLASAGTAQAIITPAVEDPEDPTDPGTPGGDSGSAGSLTGSLGGENASGSLGSLGS